MMSWLGDVGIFIQFRVERCYPISERVQDVGSCMIIITTKSQSFGFSVLKDNRLNRKARAFKNHLLVT